MTPEHHSSVPFRYRAALELTELIPAEEYVGFSLKEKRATKKAVTHRLRIAGRLHPAEYVHEQAVALANQKLQPFRDLGWRVLSLIVTASDEKDA